MVTDNFGFLPLEDGFWSINRDTWIDITPINCKEGYIYQKIADGNLVLVIKQSSVYTPCMTYRQFREIQEKKPWKEIEKQYATMMNKQLGE